MNIKITPLHLIGENERGATFDFSTRKTGDFLFASRNAGSISGNHYHKGLSSSKNPEILLLTSGEAVLFAQTLDGKEAFEETLKAPVKVEIGTYIIHTIKATTDISFVEFNSLEEHKKDTFYPKD